MTKRLEDSIAKANILPDAEQDAITEIEAVRKWEAAIAKSPEKLRSLADKAWREHEAGQSRQLDLDGL